MVIVLVLGCDWLRLAGGGFGRRGGFALGGRAGAVAALLVAAQVGIEKVAVKLDIRSRLSSRVEGTYFRVKRRWQR